MAPPRDLEATIRQHLESLPGGTAADASQTIAGAAGRAATNRMERRGGPVVKRLGYDEQGELGRGGLGVVIEATQQAFDRPVAIKRMLHAHDRAAALHFYAEAVVAAQLQHPNIIPTYDLLADAEGRLSLVMKRVYGRSWRSLLRPREPEDVAAAAGYALDDHLEILLKVCDAVGYAHSRGIIHRDLKPDNVMVGEHGEVEVMDWGCAVAFGEAEHHPVVPRVEEVERISGTPTCMAPEMVILHPNRLSPRSDVYLLGGILYDILTGTRPHRGVDMAEVLRSAAYGSVPPPHERAPDREIPGELAGIAMAALAPDPDDRTPDVASFAGSIRGYRRHAQALELAALARRRLAEAASARQATSADDRLRRACAAAENAVELWPDWPAGRALHAEAMLAWGRHCLATGGSTQAQGLAAQAVATAVAAGDQRLAGAARSLVDEVRRGISLARRRERNARLMRLGMVGMVGLVAVVAVAAAVVLAGQRRESEEARRTAEAALASLRQEQDQRRADRIESVPAMLAQLRTEVTAARLDAAAMIAGRIVQVDPQQLEAVTLQANLLAALGRHPEAVAAAQRWDALHPGDPAAGELIRLCRSADATDPRVLAGRLADLFIRQRLPSLVQGDQATPAARLAAYRARLEQSWPGSGPDLVMNDDGTVRFDWSRPGLADRADCTDLTPLRGIPFVSLNLTGTKVVDVSPLAGMPLRELTISRTAIADLRPLADTRLETLVCNAMVTRVLPDTSGLRLRSITAYSTDRVDDLAKLRGLPLEYLWTDSGRVADLSPLAGMPLKTLGVSGTFRDLSPLRGIPLETVSLGGAFTDLSPLRRDGVLDLSLRSTATVDAASLPAGIRRLTLENVVIGDPRQLRRQPLEYLRLRYRQGVSVPDLACFDASRLATLIIDCETPVDVQPLAAAPLVELSVFTAGQDFAMLAKPGIKRLAVGKPAGGSPAWRSLSAFKALASVASIEVQGRRYTPDGFWGSYQPESSQLVQTVAGVMPAVAANGAIAGLRRQTVFGVDRTVEQIAGLPIVSDGAVASPAMTEVPERTGYRFTGFLTVPATGAYKLAAESDDGVKVMLHDRPVIDGDGPHAGERFEANLSLAAGAHPVTILYFNGSGIGQLTLRITAPGAAEQPVPPAWWSH